MSNAGNFLVLMYAEVIMPWTKTQPLMILQSLPWGNYEQLVTAKNTLKQEQLQSKVKTIQN